MKIAIKTNTCYTFNISPNNSLSLYWDPWFNGPSLGDLVDISIIAQVFPSQASLNLLMRANS